MPKKKDKTCLECIKLTADEARLQHGPKSEARRCWDESKCPKKRTYYRKNDPYNAQRRVKYRKQTGQEIIDLKVPVPVNSRTELFLYRKTKSVAPHAIVGRLTIGNKIYQDGIHPGNHFSKNDAGEFKAQCNAYTLKLFKAFSLHLGDAVDRVDFIYERMPDLCPICRGDIPEK